MNWRWALGIGLGFLSLDCGSSGSGIPDAGRDAEPTADAAATVEVSGIIIDNSSAAPIAGAKVCIVDYPTIPCAITDAGGNYTVALPPLSSPVDIAFNFSAPGHLGVTDLAHESLSGLNWHSQVPLRDDASAATLLHQAGFTYPSADTAFIQLYIGAGHVRPTISPTSGTGPVFIDATGIPDPTLTAVTSAGYALFGNVTPGRIEITSSPPCNVLGFSNSWVETKPGTVTGRAVAGSITEMVMFCGNE